MKTMTAESAADMIEAVCDKVIDSKAYLTEADSKIGDGDHGFGMSMGMQKAKEEISKGRPFTDVNEVFRTVGLSMLNSMGGASGVIFGSMFLGGVKGKEPADEMDGKLFTQIMRDSLETVKKRGKAEPGDKTMVDAFEPAVIAMEQSENKELQVLMEKAADAAEEGARRTKQYTAKFGRAKSLQERAIGYEDAGALSAAIIFRAMSEFLKRT